MDLNAATEPAAELPGAHIRSRLLGPTVCPAGMGDPTGRVGHCWLNHECDLRGGHCEAHVCRCGLEWSDD